MPPDILSADTLLILFARRFPFSLIHKLSRLRRSGFALICDRDLFAFMLPFGSELRNTHSHLATFRR